MSKRLCQTCYGSGQMESGGFIKKHCIPCDGEGFVYPLESRTDQEKKLPKIDRRSKEYKHTIKELMKLGMSEEEAHKQFEKSEDKYHEKHTDNKEAA